MANEQKHFDYMLRSTEFPLDDKAILELRRFAIKNLLTLTGDIPAFDEELENHFRETKPTSLKSFLGKEHFWYIGELAGLHRKTSGELYNNVVYPLRADPQEGESTTLSPSIDLGLVVVSREQARLPQPPNTSVLEISARNKHRQSHLADPQGVHLLASQSALQVEGLSTLIQSGKKLAIIEGMGQAAINNLVNFNAVLTEIILT